MLGHTVLERLTEAFPERLKDVPKSRYWTFNFGFGATIYIPYSDPDRAHVTLSSLDNSRFPNNDRIKAFAETANVEIHEIPNREYWFRSQHIGRLISLLRQR